MSYEVVLSPHGARDLDRFIGRPYERLRAAIDALTNNPRPLRCTKLTGSDEWRIRVGEYRIRYLIDDAARVVVITRIAHRKDIYR